jgi:hypothetical protein
LGCGDLFVHDNRRAERRVLLLKLGVRNYSPGGNNCSSAVTDE